MNNLDNFIDSADACLNTNDFKQVYESFKQCSPKDLSDGEVLKNTLQFVALERMLLNVTKIKPHIKK